MAGDDGDSDATDRAAILARRQRFIALALSGLAVACGDDGNGTTTSPMPCLDVAPQTESATMTGVTQTGTDSMSSTSVSTSGSTGTPMPCLDVAPPTSSGPSDESTTSTGTDTDDGTDDGASSDSTGRPQPCLAPKG
jgi:hypothetical protein